MDLKDVMPRETDIFDPILRNQTFVSVFIAKKKKLFCIELNFRLKTCDIF